jgi:hypothetical protein
MGVSRRLYMPPLYMASVNNVVFYKYDDGVVLEIKALFGWLVASQPAVFFSHTSLAPATSHQPVNSIFLSQ